MRSTANLPVLPVAHRHGRGAAGGARDPGIRARRVGAARFHALRAASAAVSKAPPRGFLTLNLTVVVVALSLAEGGSACIAQLQGFLARTGYRQ